MPSLPFEVSLCAREVEPLTPGLDPFSAVVVCAGRVRGTVWAIAMVRFMILLLSVLKWDNHAAYRKEKVIPHQN